MASVTPSASSIDRLLTDGSFELCVPFEIAKQIVGLGIKCLRRAPHDESPVVFKRLSSGVQLGGTRRVSMTWQKQALHGEISEPERISHPVRHKVQQLFADGYF
jgi:hypothetical protein